MKTPKRPTALMTVAQVICALAVPLTLHFFPLSAIPNYVLLHSLNLMNGAGTLAFLRDLLLAALLVWVEIEAFCLCGRMKKASAFSVKNANALGRIALALGIAGMLTLLFGDSLVPFLLTGLPAVSPVVERLLLPFMLLGVALMIRTVQVLMRRAVDMQEESDLTV